MAQAVRRSPPDFEVHTHIASRSLYVGFVVDETESGRVFSGFLPFSSATNFIPPFLPTPFINFISFHFISPIPVIMRQAWPAGILVTVGLSTDLQ